MNNIANWTWVYRSALAQGGGIPADIEAKLNALHIAKDQLRAYVLEQRLEAEHMVAALSREFQLASKRNLQAVDVLRQK